MIKEFKAFIARGNVLDLAVGVIIGAAFTAIVKSLVDNLINPLLGVFIGGIDFSDMVFTIGKANFRYGSFINSVINFLIVAFIVFLIVKAVNKFMPKKEKVEETPALSVEAQYLQEISELLKEQQKTQH